MNQVPSESIDRDETQAAPMAEGADAHPAERTADEPPGPMPNAPDQNELVYVVATRQCMPAWRRIVGFSPWWDVAASARRVVHRPVLELFRQQASVFALSMGLRVDGARPDAERIRMCIRAGLIHWQEALDPQWRPVAVHRRMSRLWPVAIQQVIRTVDEIGLLHLAELPHDIARHLDWLRRRRYEDASWIESSLIEALAGGAVITRDSELHRTARERLPGLLKRQSEEGWFRERGGADVGRLSLTLDSLARLYLDHEWGELIDPLRRAIRFLSLLVHPDGTGGGCYGSCDTSFVSPYALERLSDRIPEARFLSECLRRRLQRHLPEVPHVWHDNVTALLGSAIAATATLHTQEHASADQHETEPGVTVDQSREKTAEHVPNERQLADAGLTLIHRKDYTAIVAGRRGGAMQVHWRTHERVVDYPGIMVVFAHAVRTSRAPGAGYEIAAEPGTMSWRGMLLKAGPRETRWWRLLWKATLGRVLRRRSGSVVTRFQTDTSRGRNRLLHDWFARDITFNEDAIIVRDQILTRLPPDAIVFESAIGEDRWADRCGESALREPPIVVEGARAVTIMRIYRNAALESCRVERHADFL